MLIFLILHGSFVMPYVLSLLISLFVEKKDLSNWKMTWARIALLFLSLPHMVFTICIFTEPDYSVSYWAFIAIIAQAFLLWYFVNILVYLKVKILAYAKKLFHKG